MSRGPGALQRHVLDALRDAGGLMAWDDLKERFPLRARSHSLHRAVRSLKRMGRCREVEVRGRRWLAACAPAFGEREADRELLALADAAMRQLKMVAAARGLAPRAIREIAQGANVDAYRRRTFRGE